MSLFATEFYLKPEVDRAIFLAETRAWVGGMKRTGLFGPDCREAIDGDHVHWQTPIGESLMLRALSGQDGLAAVGCRHDLPGPDGLHWRTEAVMRRTPRGNLLRVRAQCLPTRPLAVPETPKRTHLLRSLIENGRVAEDGPLAVLAGAHRIGTDAGALELAAGLALGQAGTALPVVYLSSGEGGRPVFDDLALAKLATDLCGVAHVVVEPTRAFSFQVRDRTAGRNVYGGTVGISLPDRGFVRRMHLGPTWPDAASLIEALRQAATGLRTAMPSQDGWEWHDLQDALLADQRRREKGRLTAQENEALWAEELRSKEERIRELEARVTTLSRPLPDTPADTNPALPGLTLPEIWSGEFADRLRAALLFCLEKSKDSGWDARSLAVFKAWTDLPAAPSDLDELRSELKAAARDRKRFNSAMKALLARNVFVDKSDNRHSRMASRPDFPGLEPVTLMKSPGDNRGLTNFVAQVEANLGITRLKQDR